MSNIPAELLYAETHEWVRQEDGLVVIGITDHAQAELGDLVFVELPEIDSEVTEGDAVCVVESVKAASDIYTPIAGEIVEVNEELADEPELVNNDAYGEGWLFKIKPEDETILESLMSADAYTEMFELE